MKKINYYLILGICFLLPSYLVRFSIFGVPTTLLEILIYLSALLTLVSCIKYHVLCTKNLKKNNIWIPLILFLVAGIIGVLVSPDRRVALGQFKGFILDPILFFWVILSNIKTRDQVRSMLYVFIFSGIYVSALALWQKFAGQVTPDGRIIGLFGYSPNYLAFYMVPLTLVLLFLFYFEKSKILIIRFLKVVLFFVFLYIIYLTGSRAGLIAFFGAIVGAYAIRNIINLNTTKIFKTLIIIVLIAIAGFIGYKYLKPDFSLSPEEGGRITASNNVRFQIWETTITKIIPADTNWLRGIGLGNYQNYFSKLTQDWVNYPEYISPWALTAHNLLLQTWLNLGILGIISFIWLLYIFFESVNLESQISFTIFAAMLAILIQGIIDTPYWKNDLSVMFFIFLGLIIIISNKKYVK